MLDQIDYLSDKRELISKMTNVKELFLQLGEFNIDVSDAIRKIDSTIASVESDTLSIVLVGAFSDGKTSVVAGWLNEKVENMKIDSDESSDEILIYYPASLPEGCQIVDTPGLFGDKVGSDENGARIVLSDKTKRYISEANLILYVVPAKNPIKDSHKACIRWILNDLNKLSSTIFVINRMDDVADLTDEDEFESQKRIKTNTLRSKLVECGVSQQDVDNVRIVCISAAPEGKEIEVWKDYREEYLRRSRMTQLIETTHDVLKNLREVLITKTGCDVLNDELNKALDEIARQEHDIDEIILPEKKESLKRNRKDLDALKRRISQSRGDIKDELKKLKKSKLTKIRSASMETFKEVMEDEIGIVPEKEGAILSEEITTIYNRYAEEYSAWSIDVGEKFQAEYDKQNSTIELLLKKGAAGAAKGLQNAGTIGVDTFKQAIFSGRELLGKLGVVIKFKPWQVTNMAKFASEAVPYIGAAIELIANIVDTVATFQRNRQFEKNKDEIKNAIDGVFVDCIDQINDDKWFFEKFAPDVTILEKQVSDDEDSIKQIEDMKNKYMAWSKQVKTIEFSIL